DFHVTGVQTCALPISPRPILQQGCRDDHLKPTGFRNLTTRRNAFCAFRHKPRFSENGLQPIRVGVVVTDDQDSNPVRNLQRQARMNLALASTFWSLCYKAHGPSFSWSALSPTQRFFPSQVPSLGPICFGSRGCRTSGDLVVS